MNRRFYLSVAGSLALGSAAGCLEGRLSEGNNPGTGGETPDSTGELASITNTPGELPPVWTENQEIREFFTVVTPSSDLGNYTVSVQGSQVDDAIPEENGFGIAPRHLENGENNLTVSANRQTQQLTVNKAEPEAAKLDIT